MVASEITIRYYETETGDTPFTDWLDGLTDPNVAARVAVRIDRLRQGNPGDCKSVGDGVSELRIDYGPGYRVYFGRSGNQLVILLCGGTKSGQQSDIKTAKAYWKNWRPDP